MADENKNENPEAFKNGSSEDWDFSSDKKVEDTVEQGKKTVETTINNAKQKVQQGVGNTISTAKQKIQQRIIGLFSKKKKDKEEVKAKVKENKDQTMIARKVKVCGKKLTLNGVQLQGSPNVYTFDNSVISEIKDVTKKQKLNKALGDKMAEGKELSADESFYLNVNDRKIVGSILKSEFGYNDVTNPAGLLYTKQEVTGVEPVGTYSIDLDGAGFKGNKVTFLSYVQSNMLSEYGEKAGNAHFQQFVKASGLEKEAAELARILSDENVSSQSQQGSEGNSAKAHMRESVRAQMKTDQAQAGAQSAEALSNTGGNSTHEEMRSQESVAKLKTLLNKPGVKLDDKEGTAGKLVEKFGNEAAYQIALKCMLEPLEAMKAMGEKFKRSGAAVEYFANLDANDRDIMNQALALAGVELKQSYDLNEVKANAQQVSLSTSEELQASLDIKPAVSGEVEAKYQELLGDKESLTVKDLVKAGCTRADLELVSKQMASVDELKQNVPMGYGNDGQSEVSKDFALAVIEKKMQRNAISQYLRKNKSYTS